MLCMGKKETYNCLTIFYALIFFHQTKGYLIENYIEWTDSIIKVVCYQLSSYHSVRGL